MVYTVLDIETTGGQYNKEGITEIAIYRFDGSEVTDQFISLVNPEIPIQPFVVKLTGINNAMLRSAPKFYEIAKRIIEITANTIIVAHNASFDYRVLKLEFKRLGYDFEMPSLCTVELSKKLLPEVPSYSLGKLTRSLGIPIADRHRASGDAMATLKLFKLLLSKDQEKEIVKKLVKTEVLNGFFPKWHHILDHIPPTTGIFYIHNSKGEIIYLAKSNNMFKKVSQLFTGTSKTSKRIQNEVYNITFEETGNELIGFLKERQELTINKPVLNTVQRKSSFRWALYADKNATGHYLLHTSKLDGRKKEIRAFKNQQQAESYITQLSIKEMTNPEERDAAIVSLIQDEQNRIKNVVLVLKGRNLNEKSALLIENNRLTGYCFFDLNYQLTNIEVLRNIIIPLEPTKETIHSIKYYLEKRKDYKIVRF